MKVKMRIDPLVGEVEADQFIDDGTDMWKDRHVFRDAKGAYVEAGKLGDGYVRNGDFLLTLGNGEFKAMTADEFYKTYDVEPGAVPTPKPAAIKAEHDMKADHEAKAAAAKRLADEEKAADEYGKSQTHSKK